MSDMRFATIRLHVERPDDEPIRVDIPYAVDVVPEGDEFAAEVGQLVTDALRALLALEEIKETA